MCVVRAGASWCVQLESNPNPSPALLLKELQLSVPTNLGPKKAVRVWCVARLLR